MKLLRINIKGLVQGVGFRYFTKKKAEEYNISGYVTNQYDGSVFVEAFGADTDLENFSSELRRGPSRSYVTGFTVECIETDEYPEGFNIR